MINGVKSKHRTWTDDMALKGGISAYNAGVSNVQTYEGMDIGTTGNDYANDVVARAQYYMNNGYWGIVFHQTGLIVLIGDLISKESGSVTKIKQRLADAW